MMKKNVLAVACTLAIAMVIVGLGLSTDAFAAVPHVPLHVTGLVVDGIRDLTSYMAIPLVAMRANLDDLQKRAAEKLLELKDDTAPDAARTIEADHKKLLEEIEKLKGDIRQAEVDEETQQGDRNNPPATRKVLGQQIFWISALAQACKSTQFRPRCATAFRLKPSGLKLSISWRSRHRVRRRVRSTSYAMKPRPAAPV